MVCVKPIPGGCNVEAVLFACECIKMCFTHSCLVMAQADELLVWVASSHLNILNIFHFSRVCFFC